MKSATPEIYPHGDYAPHILSGAGARRQSGRRAPGISKASGSFPWYTTYMIDQGHFVLLDPDQGKLVGEGPAVICLPPLPRTRIHIPSSTLFTWLEWGAVRLPFIFRDKINASRKYPEGLTQPQPEEVWGKPLPRQLPEYAIRPTAGMMLRVNASWWMGGSNRMLAEAELALWIARYLFPPEDEFSGTVLIRKLFPLGDDEFVQAVVRLDKSLSLGLDISDWALALGLSPRSLQRWCRQQSGLSPHGVLDALRQHRAIQMLKEKDLSLLAIARRCGFCSASAFSAWFSKSKGVSPARWREGLRQRD